LDERGGTRGIGAGDYTEQAGSSHTLADLRIVADAEEVEQSVACLLVCILIINVDAQLRIPVPFTVIQMDRLEILLPFGACRRAQPELHHDLIAATHVD